MTGYDAAVIGGGAAGLSAALVLSRARRSVVVVDAGAPRNAPAAHMHGFLSRDGMPPRELLAVGRDEVLSYGGTLIQGSVASLVPNGDSGFEVLVDGGESLRARRVLVTTGLRDELPDVPGLRERWARDVLHCPYCHGHEVADQHLGVLGVTPAAVRYAQIVRQWTENLTYFTSPVLVTATERAEFAARSVAVVEVPIERVVVEDDRLAGVQLTDGSVVGLDALFVPPHFAPQSHLLTQLGCETDDDGWVRVDATGSTSVPGVWAAGNVVDPRAQVITAAGAASAAAIALNSDLVDDDIRIAVDHARDRIND